MASPPCMSDDGRPAVFVGTMLETGDAVALCDECLVPWASALLYAMTDVDPTPFLAAISADEVTVEQVEAAEAAHRETEHSDGTPLPLSGSDDPGPAAPLSAAGPSDPPAPPARRGPTLVESREAGTGADPPDAETPADERQTPPAA